MTRRASQFATLIFNRTGSPAANLKPADGGAEGVRTPGQELAAKLHSASTVGTMHGLVYEFQRHFKTGAAVFMRVVCKVFHTQMRRSGAGLIFDKKPSSC